MIEQPVTGTSKITAIDILGATYRTNPGYSIVPAERNSAGTDVNTGMDDGSDSYGALEPRPGSGLEPRSISTDTALLVLTLQTPGPIPGYAVRNAESNIVKAIQRLVLDGVLQVLHGGEFVSGPFAAPLFTAPGQPAGQSGVRDLSVAALRYGQELLWLNERDLTLRLYFYGRQALAPDLDREFGDPEALERDLGLTSDGSLQRVLGSQWFRLPGVEGVHEHWWQWGRRPSSSARPPAGGPTYKLYVSPSVSEIHNALGEVAAALATARGATGFKVGAGLEGICRPDKIVVYFPQLDDLRRFGWLLSERLGGCAAHGVPFTAEVSADRLLSWGVDPPVTGHGDGSRRTSWRMWVAGRLAEHLKQASDAQLPGQQPWQYALARLGVGGIDTETWIPVDMAWPEL